MLAFITIGSLDIGRFVEISIQGLTTFLAVWFAYFLEKKRRDREENKIDENKFLIGMLNLQRMIKEMSNVSNHYKRESEKELASKGCKELPYIPQTIDISPSRFHFDISLFAIFNRYKKSELIIKTTCFLEAYDAMWMNVRERNRVLSTELGQNSEIFEIPKDDAGEVIIKMDRLKSIELINRVSSYLKNSQEACGIMTELSPYVILPLLKIGREEFPDTPWRKIFGEDLIRQIEEINQQLESRQIEVNAT